MAERLSLLGRIDAMGGVCAPATCHKAKDPAIGNLDFSLRKGEDVLNKSIVANRQYAFRAQNGRCFYCKARMWRSLRERAVIMQILGLTTKQVQLFRCTAEHLVPRSQGGSNRAVNIVAACLHCNLARHRRKASIDWPSYLNLVSRRITAGRWLGFRR